MNVYELFEIPITVGKREFLLSSVRGLLGRGGYVVTVNPLMLMRARRDGEFREILKNASLVIPDGVGVKLALWLLGIRTDVLPGVELASELAEKGEHRLVLYGGRAGVAAAAAERLLRKNPSLSIPLVLDGYTDAEHRAIEKILEVRPSLLYVCLGAGGQKRVCAEICREREGIVAIGLGGTLDVISGRVKRAPRWLRRLRLEWLYRMLREPRRLRDAFTLVRFFALALLSSVGFFHKHAKR